jgi:2-polyprenyl-3-methyl-5-hydroxy-6-metoxy-1,4-benzoquinol methylase
MRLSIASQEIKNYWELATPMGFVKERWGYERKRAFRYELQDYMHEAFGFDKWGGKKVLEIGCGSGIDSMEFARNGALVTATDITDRAIMLTRALAKELGLPVEVMQAPADNLPFENETFDVVYCYGVLHHIPDADRATAEIHRVLKPGGTVMVMLYHKNSLLYAYSIIYLHGIRERWLLGSLLGNTLLTENELTARYSERIEGCPYTRAYTKEEARELFERWFLDVQISVHYNVIDMPEQRKVKLVVDDNWELGWHLIIKGAKVK